MELKQEREEEMEDRSETRLWSSRSPRKAVQEPFTIALLLNIDDA